MFWKVMMELSMLAAVLHTTTATFGQGKYSYEIVTERSIDNLVKEMVGDDK